MTASLVDRLAGLPVFAQTPRAELEWLAQHGTIAHVPGGTTLIAPGAQIEEFFIALRGRVVFYTDRGGARRKVTEWAGGNLAGVMPFSRLKNSPGEAIVEEDLEYFRVHRSCFPEMITACPHVTEACVHTMLDRARLFTSSDLHDEKMASLGKLSAGLAHELNNPASAAARNAKLLGQALAGYEAATAALGAHDAEPRAALAAVLDETPQAAALHTALDDADREEDMADWLGRHGVDADLASELVSTPVTLNALDAIARIVAPDQLANAMRWVAATHLVRTLARDIERSATRIHDLVSAVKRFTYMDRATAPEPLYVAQGIRDSATVLAAKARAGSISITIEVPDDLPAVLGYGGELNQVWVNLLDNALDAAVSAVQVRAWAKGHFLTVAISDDGPGIPPDIQHRVFDPFFTTKPIGHGTGLGLDIVRRILARHDGDVTLNTQAPMTEFCVTLPVAGP